MLNLDNVPASVNVSRRQDFVRNAVTASVNDGSFTYTDCMSRPEPVRSDAIQALDGVKIVGGKGESVSDVLATDPVLLVHVDPKKSISLSMWDDVRKPGTDQTSKQKVNKDFGNAAFVPDTYPSRLARLCLHLHGYPIRQAKEGSSAVGTVVEWRWLDREVKAGRAQPEDEALHEEMLTRPGLRKLLGLPDLNKPTTKSKNADATGAPAGV